MSRIAATLLIVLVALAFNGGLLRPAFAESLLANRPAVGIEVAQPVVVRAGRVLSLLLVLEALRLQPVPLDPKKP